MKFYVSKFIPEDIKLFMETRVHQEALFLE